jgi:hypothetical protein
MNQGLKIIVEFKMILRNIRDNSTRNQVHGE